MPVKNMWSLEIGEVIVAEILLKKLKDCEIYFPLHDVGIDLLIVKGSKHVGIQVKESRYYDKKIIKGMSGISWHQLSKRKFGRDRERVNFYVFLTYVPVWKGRLHTFERRYVIIPTTELEKRLNNKNAGKRGIYSFYFHFDKDGVFEVRDMKTDYSEFDDWSYIQKALE